MKCKIVFNEVDLNVLPPENVFIICSISFYNQFTTLILKMTQQALTFKYFPDPQLMLIGGRASPEDIWQWSNSHEVIRIDNWAPGQPYGSDKCMIALSDGTWENCMCDQALLATIVCELPLSP